MTFSTSEYVNSSFLAGFLSLKNSIWNIHTFQLLWRLFDLAPSQNHSDLQYYYNHFQQHEHKFSSEISFHSLAWMDQFMLYFNNWSIHFIGVDCGPPANLLGISEKLNCAAKLDVLSKKSVWPNCFQSK